VLSSDSQWCGDGRVYRRRCIMMQAQEWVPALALMQARPRARALVLALALALALALVLVLVVGLLLQLLLLWVLVVWLIRQPRLLVLQRLLSLLLPPLLPLVLLQALGYQVPAFRLLLLPTYSKWVLLKLHNNSSNRLLKAVVRSSSCVNTRSST